jgi:hypothetical protein
MQSVGCSVSSWIVVQEASGSINDASVHLINSAFIIC